MNNVGGELAVTASADFVRADSPSGKLLLI